MLVFYFVPWEEKKPTYSPRPQFSKKKTTKQTEEKKNHQQNTLSAFHIINAGYSEKKIMDQNFAPFLQTYR